MNKYLNWKLGILIVLVALVTGTLSSNQAFSASPVPFDTIVIDGGIAGDVKLVGDIDGDDFPDLVIGGMPAEKLNWYRYPDWQKTEIATPGNEYTTDGELGDVDGDGDLDIVVPDGNSGNNLRWFENPRPGGDPGNGAAWVEHTIGSIGSWGKDIELADYDNNQRLDVATREAGTAMIFFQTGPNSWSKMTFSGVNLGSEGMSSGFVDSDQHKDLVLRGVWLKNPGGAAAQNAANWTQYNIGTVNDAFKALVADVNKDGTADVLFSSSENSADVDWWTPTTGDPTGSWTKQTIQPSLDRVHTIQVADMDLDGDNDVVLAQMHTSVAKEIMVMENLDGQATSWQKQVVDNAGLHNGVVADIGNDGDFDIYGANWTGNPPVRLYENQLDPGGSLDNWTYKQVSGQHQQTFGLAFGKMDSDNLTDIVSGRFWYKNPGGDLLGTWNQTAFPAGMHAFLVTNVDGDASPDVIAQKDEGDIALYWLEATNSGGTSWGSVLIGTVPRASHGLGAQGYRSAQIESGGQEEILISSGNGIYYFRVPANPGGGNWPRVQVNTNPSDEGFAVGDIDRDNNLDIAATTGDSKRVEWYRNPGNGGTNWTAYHIGDFPEALYPDRTELAFVNGDNRLDIIVTEENGGDSDAQTYWWNQPADPTNPNWSRTLIVSQATTNSMDTADMDADGDTDIILAEHRGAERVTIWENDGNGNLTEHLVSSGRESHLGAQVVDLDGDNDLDIVSIAWDDWQNVHLWRNDADGNPPPATPTPTSTSPPGPTQTPSATAPVPSVTATSTAGATSTPTATLPPGVTPSPTATQVYCTPTPPGATATSPVPTATQAAPTATPTGTGRVTAGLVALYLFDEGGGNILADTSGAGSPLNLRIDDLGAVSWLANGGLELVSPTIILSDNPATKIIQAAMASNELTIESWVVPHDNVQNGPVRIVSLSEDPFHRNFTVGQEGNFYDFRLRTTSTDDNGFPAVTSPPGSATPGLTHIVYTRDPSGTVQIYLDNGAVATDVRDGNLSNWDTQYQLALANELTNDRPWLGVYHLVAIYDRALTEEEVEQNFAAGHRPGSNIEPTATPVIEPSPTAILDANKNHLPIVVHDSALSDCIIVPGNTAPTKNSNPIGAGLEPTSLTGLKIPLGIPVALSVVVFLVIALGGVYFLRNQAHN